MSAADAAFPWDIFMHNIEVFIEGEGSQEAFATKVGVSFHTIEGWKRGRYKQPTWMTLDNIADTYDLTIDDLTKRRLPKSRSPH
jgi:transcriptional regulator with XRE-family HTH domain